MYIKKLITLAIALFVFATSASTTTKVSQNAPHNGMVVSAHFLASEVGVEILKKGGNAFDAAVAVQFSLAVVYPRAGNIGGGGFAVIRTSDGQYNTLDFREKAPRLAHEDMYLKYGEVVEGLSRKGHLAVGVPGTVDGMVQLHKKYGKLNWETLLDPAIELAANGVVLTHLEAQKLNAYRDQILQANPQKSIPYACFDLFVEGDTLANPDLAVSLKRIKEQGRKGFYEGKTADLIVEEMKRGRGLIFYQDLKDYKSVWRDALVGEYRSYKVISMPPPSSGGVALLQLLKGAEMFDVGQYGFGSTEHVHLLVELERRVYADRATWLGDPDFYPVPTEGLISEEYLSNRFADIEMNRKTNSQYIKAGKVEFIESFETTHFSITDKEGSAIAVTTTLNGNYGSKVVVDGGGFFLNNEMDDFSIMPGAPNQFGLVGGKANAIQPEKRMLSSMTPTIVEKDGQLFMVLGSPGGATIITCVFQNIVDAIDFGMSPQQTVNAPRFHSQWLPDEVYAEPGAILPEAEKQLLQMGHVIKKRSQLGMMCNIFVDSYGKYVGAADTVRHKDSRALGY